MLRNLKGFLSVIVAIFIIATAIPFSAFAQTDIHVEIFSEQFIPNGDIIPNNDELFALYAQNEFEREIYGDIATFGSAAINRFEDGSIIKNIYNEIVTKAKLIANGTETSSAISISSTTISSLRWTESELGTAIVIDGTMSPEAQAILKQKFSETINTEKLWSALLADHPYEFYWFDKTIGIKTGYSISYAAAHGGNEAYAAISALTISFSVATDYRGAGEYVLNTAKTSATSSAINNAKSIVASNATKSDIDKLSTYKDKICELVSYNNSAAGSSSSTVGINPWQLIYVFDGDSATNVVCEGYSKAFQYLCDLSTFTDNIYCYSVSGWMNGGRHMWNIVEVGENRYLADITNCDTGTIGYPNNLFMVVGESYYNAKIHYFTIGNTSIEYDYEPSEKDLYCDGYLELKETLPVPELIFENNGYNIPNMTVGTAIPTINVSSGVSGGLAPYRFSAINLPNGININSSSGIISGTPTTESNTTTTATITVTDANNNSKSITIFVGTIVSPHICSYDQKVIDSKYFISGPTCTQGTTYISSCTCGIAGGDLFFANDKLGHSYTTAKETDEFLKTKAANCTTFNTYWYSCSRCNTNAKSDPDATECFFVGSTKGIHNFNEKIKDTAHYVSNIDYNCKTHLQYYYDCEFCNTIGTTSWQSEEVGKHKMADNWSFENDTHYKKCTIDTCDYIGTLVKCSGGTATCQQKASCDICHNHYGSFAPHNLEFIKATPSTCTESGNIDYYICICGKLFKDETATIEILNKSDINIPTSDHEFDLLKHNEDVHWNECACGKTNEEEKHFDIDLNGKCDKCERAVDILTFILGDADNNGTIEADDYILLKRLYFGTAKIESLDHPETLLVRCDLNNSGAIDADDYIYLKRIFFGTFKI